LKRGPNREIGEKDFFEIAFNHKPVSSREKDLFFSLENVSFLSHYPIATSNYFQLFISYLNLA